MTPTPTPEVNSFIKDDAVLSSMAAEVARRWKALGDPSTVSVPRHLISEAASLLDSEAYGPISARLLDCLASPQPVVAPSDLSGEDGLSKTIPTEQAGDVAPQRLLTVVNDLGFTSLYEPNEDGEPGDLVAHVLRDDWLPMLVGCSK